MRIFRFFIAPFLAGTIICAVVMWGFKGFSVLSGKQVWELILKSMIPSLIVIIVFALLGRKKGDAK